MKRFLRWPLIFLVLLVACALWFSLRRLPDGRLHVWFLNVGQGDAILIQTPEGRQVLVDGGPSAATLLSELSEIMPFWDRSLDLVILTHADADHLTGLIPLLERYRVATVLDAVHDTSEESLAWADAVEEAGSRRTLAERGLRVALGSAMLTVLHPAAGCSGEATNTNSIVARLDHADISVLLTGDADDLAERELLATDLPLQADVLKVGHHGSATSTSAAFLDAVAPSLAVIQVGLDNFFGHPSASVLERLADVTLLRTDRNGRVEVISDGARLWSRTER